MLHAAIRVALKKTSTNGYSVMLCISKANRIADVLEQTVRFKAENCRTGLIVMEGNM